MALTEAPVSLPQVNLKDRRVPFEVLSLLSLSTMEKYQVASFELNDQALKLAVVYPEQLKQGFLVALKDIGRKINRKVELYRTDAASLQTLVRQYRVGLAAKEEAKKPKPQPIAEVIPVAESPAPSAPSAPAVPVNPAPASSVSSPVPAAEAALVSPAPDLQPVPIPAVPAALAVSTPGLPKPGVRQANDPKPPLFELGRSVAFNYLKRIPLEFARAHRLVSVDFYQPNIYWFATDGTHDQELAKIIPFIEENNTIKVYCFVVGVKDLNDLLDYYREMIEQEKINHSKQKEKLAKEEKKQRDAELEKAILNQKGGQEEKEQKIAKGVIMPDVQAAIITAEEEKGGIAGLFQKVTQNLGNAKDSPIVIADPDAVPLPLAATAGMIATASLQATPAAQANPASAQTLTNPATQPAPEKKVASPEPIKKEAPSTADPATKVNDEESSELGKLLTKSVDSLDELKEFIKKGYIPRIVAAIVSFAIHEKASDIHVEVFEDEVRIRYRVDGQLSDVVKLPPDVHASVVSRIKILSRLRLDETRIPQDGRFDVNFNDAQVDLRVSVMPTVHGEKVVMRILDKSKGIATLDVLGIQGLANQNLLKAIQRPFGICLATGPTGSGKSTTLYAILNRIATPNVNVITLEDPVEYEMKGINQSQIRPKIGFSFAEGLRAILRQDPNIIMVGEIRDGETANMATQAALTGHLVLSTLHTNDAAGAIPRLMNMGIEPFLITSSVNVVIGQRLVRKICQKCKTEIPMPEAINEKINKDLTEISRLNAIDARRVIQPYKFYQGVGCAECSGKGYRGRMGIYEVLLMSDALEELALQRASASVIQQKAQEEGMLTLYQDGLLKVIAGLTTLDEVLRETSNK